MCLIGNKAGKTGMWWGNYYPRKVGMSSVKDGVKDGNGLSLRAAAACVVTTTASVAIWKRFLQQIPKFFRRLDRLSSFSS